MKLARRLVVLVVLAVLASAAPVTAPSAALTGGTELLFGSLGTNATTSDLYLIDADTGALDRMIGPIGFAVTGLAVHPQTGVLYGSTSHNSAASPRSLIRIDPVTGAGTLIGAFNVLSGANPQTAADIAFAPDGTLYGIFEPSLDDLYTINLTTGAGTLVGVASQSTAGSGLAYDTATGKLLWGGEGAQGSLLILDRTTGTAVDGPTLTGSAGREIAALDFGCDGTTLFGVQLDDAGGSNPRPTELVTINQTSGAVTVLGSSIEKLDAIAAACEFTWIDAVYRELLGRRADNAGKTFWGNAVKGGATPIAVASAIEGTPEARAAFVNGLYLRYLGRVADPGGLAHFVDVTARLGPLAARVSILASPEYATKAGGTPNGYVNALYADVLGRPAGDADRAFWTGILASRGPGALAGGIVASAESIDRIITTTYARVLRRAPDSAGLTHWRSQFAAGMDEHTLVVILLGSAEYVGRFPAVA
jgi:hypothetical protein